MRRDDVDATLHDVALAALRGDGLAAVLRAAVAATEAAGATGVQMLDEAPVDLALLARSEIGWDEALDAAGIVLVPSSDAGTDAGAGVGAPIAPDGARLGTWIALGAPADAQSAVADIAALLSVAIARIWTNAGLEATNRQLVEAQRHAHVGSFDWDIVGNKVHWSDELYRIYGCEPQSFEPSFEEFLERIHPDDRESVRASVFQAYEEGRSYRILERIVRPDGTMRQLSSWGEMFLDQERKPVRIIGSCKDITDELAHEQVALELDRIQRGQRQALDINDNIVQSLAAAEHFLVAGDHERATRSVAHALSAARGIVGRLLTDATGSAEIVAGDLVRAEAAPSASDHPMGFVAAVPDLDDDYSPINVVIADDCADMRFLLRSVLGVGKGFAVTGEADNGREAVALVDRLQPHAVVLDLAMPEMDGLTAIPLVRQAAPRTKIVVVSGFDQEGMEQRTTSLGADAYVEKGARTTDLRTILRRLCAS